MRYLKRGVIFALILSFTFSLVSCKNKESESSGSKETKIALVLPGSLNDGGWNANAYEGLMELKEEGYEVGFTENVQISAIEEALTNYAANDYDLIIGHGFEFGEPSLRVSSQFPDVNFFVSGKMPDGVNEKDLPENVGFMDMKEYEAAYLAGVLAAGVTETNVIGYIAGLEIPAQLANMAAFVTAVNEYNPEAKVYGVVTGTFEDSAKGQEAAMAQMDLDADIIVQTADTTGMGAIQAATNRNKYIIGYGADQNNLQPDLVLTSIVTDNSKVVKSQVDRINENKFGGLWEPGLDSGLIYITPYHNLDSKIPEEIKKNIEQAKDDIISGKKKVPCIYERIDQQI